MLVSLKEKKSRQRRLSPSNLKNVFVYDITLIKYSILPHIFGYYSLRGLITFGQTVPSVKGTKCTNSSAKTIKRRSTFPAFKAHLEQWSYVM